MKKTAFSLIELTIVLIIIGLLATVVIGSQSLINSATLSSARSKTKASPVNHIENLVFWLDSTSENSFDGSESSDESLISIWKDLNLQKTTKNDASSSGSSRPIYIKKSLNKLPAIKFDGVDDYMSIDPALLPIGNEGRTYFFVVSDVNGTSEQSAFHHGNNTAGGRMSFTINSTTIAVAVDGHNIGNDSLNNPKNMIISIYNAKNANSGSFNFRRNNAQITKSTLAGANRSINTSANGSGKIGSNFAGDAFFTGNFNEIIIFNKELSISEIIDIEEYLSSKWNIKLE